MTASGNIRNRNAQLGEDFGAKPCRHLYSHAQFEDDTSGNIQPVKVMVEDVTKTAVEFPCTSDDAGGGVQDPL